MNCRLIAFDLDGTLFDDMKNISDSDLSALRAAGEKGIYTVPASGRLLPFIPAQLKELPGARYYIMANGNGVYDTLENRSLYSADVSLESAISLFNYLDTIDTIYDVYCDDRGFINRTDIERADEFFTDPVLNHMLHSYILAIRDGVDDLRAFVYERGKPLQKIQMYFRSEELRQRMLTELPLMFPEFVFSSSLGNNIEVNSRDATKGKALSALCREAGIPICEAVAFGDGLNDLDMLQAAGLGVAMPNGENTVKAAADTIAASDNNHSGIYETLKLLQII